MKNYGKTKKKIKNKSAN